MSDGREVTAIMQPCRSGYLRHWFAARGLPGVALPSCARCGIPNPKWSAAVSDEMEHMGYGADWRADEGWANASDSGS